MNFDQDVYVKLLEEAKEELKGEGIDYREFMHRVENKYKLKQSPLTLYQYIYDAMPSNKKHHMGIEAYMQLVEFQELKHALEESKEAKRQARIALYLTLASLAISSIIGVIQIIIAID